MVATQQLLDTLKTIGLNLYERKLWVALLSRGTSTAGELSTLAKVPHSRTYDVLESLADKGFVMIQTSKPLKFVAIQPAEALSRAKSRLYEKTNVSAERIDKLTGSTVLKELDRIHKNGVELIEPGELTGSLKGRRALHQQFETLFKNAKKSVSIVTSAQGLEVLGAKHADVLKKAAGRGVKVRIAAPVGKGVNVSHLKKFADVKKLDSKNGGRFCVVDNSHVVLALTDDKSVHETQDFGLWTQSNHVAGDVLGPMFDNMWSGLKSA